MSEIGSSQEASPSRIVIIGTSGCGKTYLGRQLSNLTGYKSVDLDDLFWKPGWIQRDDGEFISLLKKEVSASKWIISGNLSRANEIFWPQADLIIWLDLPLSHCLWHAFKRSISRCVTREPCCNGNYESWARLIGKNSILRWIRNSPPRRKKAYETFFNENAQKRSLLRLKSRQEVNQFLAGFKCYST